MCKNAVSSQHCKGLRKSPHERIHSARSPLSGYRQHSGTRSTASLRQNSDGDHAQPAARQIPLTAQERNRLLKFGKPLGSKVKQLITIVSPRTFARWLSAEREQRKPAKRGRPRKPPAVRDLILRLARENGWGYTRIVGELKKLGVRKVATSTIRNILRQNGFDLGPKRGEGTWSDFIKRHADSLYACDFFSKKVWTMRGLVDIFVLFFIHIGSRRVHIAGMTPNPDRTWMIQQARNVSMFFAEQPNAKKILIRDHDGKFVREFDDILRSSGVTVARVGPAAPNLNALAERWVQSVRNECLNHFMVFGEDHLRYLINQYTSYYLQHRPHQAKDNRLLTGLDPPEAAAVVPEEIHCEVRLGGLLKHYYRRAA
jgi:putative transposase